jgi:uncharacterized protein YneR
MARIRTIKPQLFRHETLFNLEKETGLPIRLAWIGLFTVVDREGRFRWRPKEIKLDILPWDDEVDFDKILTALASVQLIQRYQVNGEFYGWIPTWHSHQHVNSKEAQSVIPGPDLASSGECPVKAPAIPVNARGEREEEKEGKRKGNKERERISTDADASELPIADVGSKVWNSYEGAYLKRYGTKPVRNKKTNGIVKQIIQRLGQDDASEVVRFYVEHNDSFYLKNTHQIDYCLKSAESLHTQWQRGRAVTSVDVRQFEKADHYQSQMNRLKAGGGL